MQHHSLDDVVGRVPKGDNVGPRLAMGSFEELVAKRAGGGLDRASRERGATALGDELNPKAVAQAGDVLGDRGRAGLQGVVEVR